ncbi:Protein of unknown function DUF3669, zinc finger protein [Paramyrothecium foliicola]|nr:Protein of unknown function DUF3669, zinc finger protein [Paramyrothecium foliicola]
MDRRDLAKTDESAYSLAESIKDLAVSGLKLAADQILTDEELATAKPEQILSRMLSTRSYISTTSSLAELNNAAQINPAERRFLEVGKAKLPNSADKVDQLFVDLSVHHHILESMAKLDVGHQLEINIPWLHQWVSPESKDFWAQSGLLFPNNVDAKSYALVSQRIFPVPEPVREAIVDALCPAAIKKHKQQFLARSENKNCLVRLYLGRRDTFKSKTNLPNIKLQNFPLHVNEMEALQLDCTIFARTMAQTLAFLHWKVGVDGNDIEFILGSSPAVLNLPRRNETRTLDKLSLARRFPMDFAHRSLEIWLIDFNQCAYFEDDSAGLQKLVNAFVWNDPYYPRPGPNGSNDQKLWAVFRQRYLEVSQIFTKSRTPERFISKIEEQGKKGTVDGLFGKQG